MPLGIDPTVDYAFKRLFGMQEHSQLLVHLLNAILTPKWPIVAVEIQNPFNEKEFENDKLSILDVKAIDARKALFNVEMQTKATNVLRQRLPYYNASLMAAQLLSGQGYHELLPVISICILKEPLFPQIAAPHLNFMLRDCQHGVQFTDCVQIHTIELAKYNFPGQLPAVAKSLSSATALERWAFFFNRAAELDLLELKQLLPEEIYLQATGVVEMIAQTEEERMRYEARRLAELDFKSFVHEASQEAELKGLEKGLEQGLEKGLEKGLEQGRKLGMVEQVRLCQSLLHDPVSAETELLAMELESLSRLCDELKRRLTEPQ